MQWENILQKLALEIDQFSNAYIQIYIGKGVKKEVIAKLNELEE